MIGGKLKNNTVEADYRALGINSYSTLKDFDTNRLKFYKKYILKDKSVQFDDEKEHIILGSMVDVLDTGTQQDFDNKFAMITAQKTSGQMAEFGDELWRLTKQATGEDGTVGREFLSLAEDALNGVKYNKTGEAVKFKGKDIASVLGNFKGSSEEILYNERRQKFGKIIVTTEEVNKGEKIHGDLLSTSWTADILTHSSNEDFEVLNQLQIVFEIHGMIVKSMLDKVHIDHIEKTIQPYDLKISYLVNNFGYSYFKQKYYLQVGMYDFALVNWAFASGLNEYKILPMKFIVADSTLQSKPVIWETSPLNVEEGLYGFTYNGRYYKGVYAIVDELKWCMEEQIWSTPKEVFDNHGIMKIKPFSEGIETVEDES